MKTKTPSYGLSLLTVGAALLAGSALNAQTFGDTLAQAPTHFDTRLTLAPADATSSGGGGAGTD